MTGISDTAYVCLLGAAVLGLLFVLWSCLALAARADRRAAAAARARSAARAGEADALDRAYRQLLDGRWYLGDDR